MTEKRNFWTTAFDTVVGPCTLSWTNSGITRLRLDPPMPSEQLTAEPPRQIREAIARIKAHLAGAKDPFDRISVDLGEQTPFQQEVYETLRRLPPGETITYGELAARVGRPGAARAVGRAMATNPIALIVPCHRVVPATGGVGSYSAAGGARLKQRLLEIEKD